MQAKYQPEESFVSGGSMESVLPVSLLSQASQILIRIGVKEHESGKQPQARVRETGSPSAVVYSLDTASICDPRMTE